MRYGRAPFGPALNTELFLPQRIVAVGSPALLQAQGRPTDLQHLQRHTLLHDAHNFWPDFIGEVFGQPLQAAARNVRFNQTALAIDAAIAGQGLALASYHFVQSDLAAGRLALAFDHHLLLDQAFYLVWPRNAYQAPALDTVHAWLLEQARQAVEFLSTD